MLATQGKLEGLGVRVQGLGYDHPLSSEVSQMGVGFRA